MTLINDTPAHGVCARCPEPALIAITDGPGNVRCIRHAAEIFPPADFIRAECAERGWTVRDLAAAMHAPLFMASDLYSGSEPISPLAARRLARAFGTSADLWRNLQQAWEGRHAR